MEARSSKEKQKQETNYDDDYGDGATTEKLQVGAGGAPGKIFAPGGKLVSERLRSMTEDERSHGRTGKR